MTQPGAWPAPAKLNLMLRVVGRRPDGYHLLQTILKELHHSRVRKSQCCFDAFLFRNFFCRNGRSSSAIRCDEIAFQI